MSNGPSPHIKSGTSEVGYVEWGTHLCQFYENKRDLLRVLIAYFQAGLEQNEKCIWTVFDPLNEYDVRSGIASAYPGVARRITAGDLEIVGPEVNGTATATADPGDTVGDWEVKLIDALEDGYTGLRLNANPMMLSNGKAKVLEAHERAFGRFLADRRALVLCCYPAPVEAAGPASEIGFSHQYALARRYGRWSAEEPPEQGELRVEVERLTKELSIRATERTRELAASAVDFTREVASRLESDRALRESEDRFRFYFGLPLVGLAMMKPGPKQIQVNDRLCEISGYTRAELERMEWADVAHPDDLETDLSNYAQLLAGTLDSFKRAKRWIRKDGELVHTNTSINCQRHEDGSIHYVAVMVEEITSPDEISARNIESSNSGQLGQPHLSGREVEVARLIGLGHTVKEIASALRLSEKTVSTYRGRILGKLKLKNTAELIRYTLKYYLPR